MPLVNAHWLAWVAHLTFRQLKSINQQLAIHSQCPRLPGYNSEELNMGGSKGGGKKSGGESSSPAPQNNNFQAQQAAMQAQMEQQRQAAEAERKRREAEEAERIRQQNIQAENQKAADFRRQAETQLQKDFTSAAQNQQRLDQQTAQNAASTTAGGSGYNVGSAQQQKIAAAGGVAGPASTNAPSPMQMGLPPILASNAGVGGTQQNTNFSLPSAQGLQFGGM
jgi:hypothetical protein